MTGWTSDMIVSGVPYKVMGVDGRSPSTLEDFAGPVTMRIHGPTGDHKITGLGEQSHEGTVRLHEKDADGDGEDVRVWVVSPAIDRQGFDAAG